MEELINQKKELEDKLLTLKQQNNTLELNINIMNIENELENELKILNDRIKTIKHQQRTQNIDTIRTVLGVTFTDNYYANSGQDITSPPTLTYKTLNQIQEEYTQLDLKLKEKLNDEEITIEEYKNSSDALRKLYYEYKNNTVNKEQLNQTQQTKINTSTNSNETNPNKSKPEEINYFENFRIETRKNHNYDNMSNEEKKDFDRKLEEIIKLRKKRKILMDKYGYEYMSDDEKYNFDISQDERENIEIEFREKLINKGIDPEQLPNYDQLVEEEIEKNNYESFDEIEEHKRRL